MLRNVTKCNTSPGETATLHSPRPPPARGVHEGGTGVARGGHGGSTTPCTRGPKHPKTAFPSQKRAFPPLLTFSVFPFYVFGLPPPLNLAFPARPRLRSPRP